MGKLNKNEKINNMNLVGHLTELRGRIMIAIGALFFGVLIGFNYADWIIERLLKDTGDLVYLYPGEAFFAHLKIALILGIVIASPILIYQILQFAFPAFGKAAKKAVVIGLPFSVLLFCLGTGFAYFVIVPFTYKFFMGFGTDSLTALISIGSYLSFVLGLVIPFSVVFQLPLIVAILTWIGILSPEFLTRSRKYTILIVFIVAAILTPPDIISQTMMAIPMLILYEFSVVLAKIIYRYRQRRISVET